MATEAVQRFVLSSPFRIHAVVAPPTEIPRKLEPQKQLHTTSANPIYIFIENVTLLCPKADTVRGCKVLNGYTGNRLVHVALFQDQNMY